MPARLEASRRRIVAESSDGGGSEGDSEAGSERVEPATTGCGRARQEERSAAGGDTPRGVTSPRRAATDSSSTAGAASSLEEAEALFVESLRVRARRVAQLRRLVVDAAGAEGAVAAGAEGADAAGAAEDDLCSDVPPWMARQLSDEAAGPDDLADAFSEDACAWVRVGDGAMLGLAGVRQRRGDCSGAIARLRCLAELQGARGAPTHERLFVLGRLVDVARASQLEQAPWALRQMLRLHRMAGADAAAAELEDELFGVMCTLGEHREALRCACPAPPSGAPPERALEARRRAAPRRGSRPDASVPPLLAVCSPTALPTSRRAPRGPCEACSAPFASGGTRCCESSRSGAGWSRAMKPFAASDSARSRSAQRCACRGLRGGWQREQRPPACASGGGSTRPPR